MKITWFGHSCFRIDAGASSILIYPFFSFNQTFANAGVPTVRPDCTGLTVRQSGGCFREHPKVAAYPARCYSRPIECIPQSKAMSVDRATVRRIAHLARIAISGEEEVQLEHELNGILDFIAQLDEIDTSAVEPMTRVAAMTMKKRKDEVTDGFCADQILKSAPKADDHYFVVPKIIE